MHERMGGYESPPTRLLTRHFISSISKDLRRRPSVPAQAASPEASALPVIISDGMEAVSGME